MDIVIPAAAGIQAPRSICSARDIWPPAFAGVTELGSCKSDKNSGTRYRRNLYIREFKEIRTADNAEIIEISVDSQYR